MSTGYEDTYYQAEDGTWTYKIQGNDRLIYESINEAKPFRSLREAEQHCLNNHANSGSSGAIPYRNDKWDYSKREDVVTALRMHGGNIHNVKSETFLADKELIMLALQYELNDLQYASDTVKDDFDFVVEVMKLWAKEEKAKYENSYSDSWTRTNPFKLDIRSAETWSPLQYASSRVKELLIANPSHYCK
jgi:hypothetical protein